MKAVRFDRYGGPEVLEVREVEDPVAVPGEVVVAVEAAGIQPGEISVREGYLHGRFPATFPSGEGSDLAGVVATIGDGVTGFALGDEVLGWSERRSSHAELVLVPEAQLVSKPAELAWEAAGSLFVVSMAAWASVEAVGVSDGDVVAVSAAAGGVGGFAAQLAKVRGARVIGLASEANHEWLRSHGIEPVAYGEGQAERLRSAAAGSLDAFIDTFGGGYVDLAVELGVTKDRINTIIDYEAVGRLGVKGEGTHGIGTAELLAQAATLVAEGAIELPIARTYPLREVRAAFEDLARRRTRGKIVLIP